MKNRILTVFIFLSFIAPAFAADNASAPVAVPASSESAAPLGFVVTGDGKLIPEPGSIFTQGGDYEGKEMPYLVSTPQPISYPRWAIRQGWEGRLSLAIEVRTDGTVGKTKVMQSTGHKILDQAAEKAIRTWHFHPTMKDGRAIRDCVQIPVTFKLDDK